MTGATLEEPKNERPFLTLGQVLSANRSTNGRMRKGHVRQGSGSHDEATQFLDRRSGVMLLMMTTDYRGRSLK